MSQVPPPPLPPPPPSPPPPPAFHGTGGPPEGPTRQEVSRGCCIAFVLFVFFLLFLNAIGGFKGSPTAVRDTPSAEQSDSPTPTSSPAPTEAPTPAKPSATAAPAAKLSAGQKQQVRTVLTAVCDHELALLRAGQAALGTTQYSDSSAAADAFNHPNSAASRFRAWRTASGVDAGLSYASALTAANAIYDGAGAKAPQALQFWGEDSGDEQAAVYGWVLDAVGWQIMSNTSADLQADVAKLQAADAKARADIEALLAAS